MSESGCTGSCSSCTEECASRKPSREELLEPANKYSKIKRIIGIVSGKGGVGKSFVTSAMAVNMQRRGYQTAIMDADITGPSIPKSFNIHTKVKANEMGIFPEVSEAGTRIMSINLLIDKEETPVVWRGPVIAGTVKQFWTEVVWGEVDYMFVDMPPGTGDVPLTVFQSIPLDGIIIVTSPQDLVSMIVKKAVNMAKSMEIPILGIIENYSYLSCENCGEKISLFGESHVEEVAKEHSLKVLAKLPLDPKVAQKVDEGAIEQLDADWFKEATDFLEQVCPCEESNPFDEISKIAVTTDEDNNVFQHFGSCSKFSIFHIEKGQLVSKESIMAQETGHTAVAKLLIEAGVNAVICGGIGMGAIQALMEKQIMVIPGQQGNIEQAVQDFLSGDAPNSNMPTCNHKEHHGDVGENGCACGCGGSCHS